MNKSILILDNLDSFTYNLYHLVGMVFSGKIFVLRDYEITSAILKKISAIILSPGPQKPENFPMNAELINSFYKKLPILGVCLGMQAINEYFGGKTIYAPEPVHGKTSRIIHQERNLFKNIPQYIHVARYHSLSCSVKEDMFDIDAYCLDDKVVMAIKLKEYPTFGLQYHPESFLTDFGKEIILNFLSYV